MVSENRNTPSVQQTAHQPIRFKPIHFTPHQVALMAQIANELSADFVRALHPYMTQAFIRYHLEGLAEPKRPTSPQARACAQHEAIRTGGFTWIPR